ncbi:hypothetical protein [Clostridium sp. UBA1056]|uniref:hypothetical protein n=1 Tax=unclassified Clostridium TaxID=2614128 RepID=UPI0032177879
MFKKVLISLILFIIVYILITNNYIYNTNDWNNLSPLIVDNKQINEITNKIKINESEVNIIQEKFNDKIKGFSVEEVTESNQVYLYPVCSSHAGKDGVVELSKIDFQNFFFSNINNDKRLKKSFEEALNIKLNVNQTKDINQEFNIDSNNNINVNTYIVYKVFNIQLSKKGLLNKRIVIDSTIALAYEIVFDVKEY